MGVTTLASVKWTITARCEEVDVSAFEDGPYVRVRPGMRDAEISVEGFWEETLHQNPPDLVMGEYVSLALYPDRNNLPGRFFYFPLILITQLAIDAEVRGLVKITLTGKADGPFNFPFRNLYG